MTIQTPITLRRRGGETKIVLGGFRRASPNDNTSLKQMLVRAVRWAEDLKSGSVSSIAEIAAQEEMDPGDVSRYLPLVFLVLDISEATLSDRALIDLTIHKIKRLNQIPIVWDDQRKVLGFGFYALLTFPEIAKRPGASVLAVIFCP